MIINLNEDLRDEGQTRKRGNDESYIICCGFQRREGFILFAPVDTIIQPLKPVTLGKLVHRIDNNAA